MAFDKLDRELAELERSIGHFSGEHYTLDDLKIDKDRPELSLKLHEIRTLTLLNLNRMHGAARNEIMDYVLENCINMSQSRFSLLGVLDNEEKTFALNSWTKETMDECRVEGVTHELKVDGAGLWAEPIRQRRTVVLNEYPSSHTHKKGVPEGHVPIIRYMGVPIFEGDRIVCMGAVANKETDYDESDRKSFEAILYDMWRLLLRNSMEEKLKEKYGLVERMNRLMVGREVSIHEVKERNKRLSEQLSELRKLVDEG